ncbi:hypothetical protein LEP1GSC017_0423 [Leptospira meyeri serovar Hardjo str. Went 5]|nr:hypothetical protein LEP1GSC017_0423 [Leptospira meyeri serovar Hardjo str. Went 5]
MVIHFSLQKKYFFFSKTCLKFEVSDSMSMPQTMSLTFIFYLLR